MVRVASETAGTKLRGVARRPARGSLWNFLSDLRDLLRYSTLKATVQEFLRDDALGLAAQLAFYLILAIFPFILFCVAILDAFSSSDPPLRGHIGHGLGGLRRLRRPHKRPEPCLRRAGDAAVLEGEGHRHLDD